MFDSVLVANRGEIAVRIIRTLSALGIRSIAVYSDADAAARHVGVADEAYRLGPAAASASYLAIDRIIDVALQSGAQALHPGYGFLAENAALADACAAAGIVFIGPPVDAISVMGDKIRAKETVAGRGVRVVPGVSGIGLSDEELCEQAATIGFPILIKPSAGGGGKGMRLVTSAEQLPAEIAAAKREAASAFGNDTLLVERFVLNPRHIEVQVLADSHGNVVHLGERECSLQRRHQKVIEEAPSPLLTASARESITAQAVAAAQACGYVNAGTVEFIVSGDEPDAAYFMEMNTRLQVEHPVTELVWGVDLVELQLRVASGERLPFTQVELSPQGHAMEARLYAEDPNRGFLPTGGRVLALDEPDCLPNVRVDSSLSAGLEVGSTYDPMLAKVIAWGVDRKAARRTLDAALSATVVLGLTTNIEFLRAVLADPNVVAGQMDTELVERIADGLPAPEVPWLAVAAAALAAQIAGPASIASQDPWQRRDGWRIGQSNSWAWRAKCSSGQSLVVHVRAQPDRTYELRCEDGPTIVASGCFVGERIRIDTDQQSATFVVVREGRTTWLGRHGGSWSFTTPDVGVAGARAATTDAVITSPMPGTVMSITAQRGDTVVAGQPVAVVEAMKMEHTLRAEIDGVVTDILVGPGDRVAFNQIIAVIGPHDPAQPESELEEQP